MKKTDALSLRSATIKFGFALMIVFAGVLCQSAGLAPLAPQKPIGSTTLEVGTSYVFSTSAIDPDSDMVALRFDWGDGNMSSWGAYVSSGQIDSASHTWTKAGTFDVKAQAKDQHGNTSPWSPELAVTADTGAAGVYYFEGFEQESTWAHWELLPNYLSYIGTGYAHTGNYSAILGDTGSYGWPYCGTMELSVPIDVRSCSSSAVVSFWYNALYIPYSRIATIYSDMDYLNNSGEWKSFDLCAVSIDSTNRWRQVSVDITPYCGIMRYAKISVWVEGRSWDEDEIKASIDDIEITRKD